MIRLVVFLVAILAIASGLAWLADRPGSLVLNWQGYEIETSVFRAIVILALLAALALLAWNALRTIWLSPALLGRYMRKQRQRKGLDALSSGMIAISAGDRGSADRYAKQARKSLPNEPLTHLLRAQSAQLTGDRATAKRIYESMLSAPDTELLGLRGLYLEATDMNEPEAARHFAARALEANPALSWPVDATFKHQAQEKNWVGALETLATARRYGHVDKPTADRRRAVLLTAQAQLLEDDRPEDALKLALEAHGLAKDLIPAAAIAGRLLASKGNTGKAAKVLQKTWTLAPHPDLATAFAYARIGDSPKDRLERVRKLAALTPKDPEGPISLAAAALEAREFDIAKHALAPLLEDRLTQRVATLMARIEGEQNGDKGRVREWLARAITAPRDPAWTADGVVSEQWAPISPVSGELDAFEWRTPVARVPGQGTQRLTDNAEELIAVLAAAQQQPALETVSSSPAAATDTATETAETRTAPAPAPASAPTTVSNPSPAEKDPVDASAPNAKAADAADATAKNPSDAARNEPFAAAPKKKQQPAEDAELVTVKSNVGHYASKKGGRKKKKKFQHHQASVAIKSEKTANSAPASESNTSPPPKTDTTGKPAPEPYVAPRAPDDPGPDASDQDITGEAYKGYRRAST